MDSGSDRTCQNEEVRSGTGRSRHVGNWFTGQSAGISAEFGTRDLSDNRIRR